MQRQYYKTVATSCSISTVLNSQIQQLSVFTMQKTPLYFIFLFITRNTQVKHNIKKYVNFTDRYHVVNAANYILKIRQVNSRIYLKVNLPQAKMYN